MVQVLSHSVAAGLLMLVDLGTIGKGACVTAKFVEMMNNLFDCFNSSTEFSSVPYKAAFRDESSTFLQKVQEWLKTVQCAIGNIMLPCLNEWRHNINALRMLWDDVKGAYGLCETCSNFLSHDYFIFCIESALQLLFKLPFY